VWAGRAAQQHVGDKPLSLAAVAVSGSIKLKAPTFGDATHHSEPQLTFKVWNRLVARLDRTAWGSMALQRMSTPQGMPAPQEHNSTGSMCDSQAVRQAAGLLPIVCQFRRYASWVGQNTNTLRQ
jgi:hypothetical protein